jgi:hypothetical protein
MIEIIYEFILVTLFSYPGGFIRWILFRKKSLKAYFKDDHYNNAGVFLIFILLVALLIYLINQIV